MAGDSAYIDIVEAFGIRLIVETDPENPSNGERGPAPVLAGGVFVSALATSRFRTTRAAMRARRGAVQGRKPGVLQFAGRIF